MIADTSEVNLKTTTAVEITMHAARKGAGRPSAELRAVARAYTDFAGANPALYEAMFTLAVDLGVRLSPTRKTRRPRPLARSVTRWPHWLATVTWKRSPRSPGSALHGLVTLSRAGRLRPDYYDQRLAMIVDQLGAPAD